MYDIPERTDIRKCIITEETIREGRLPLLLTKTEVDKRRRRDELRRVARRARRDGLTPRAPGAPAPRDPSFTAMTEAVASGDTTPERQRRSGPRGQLWRPCNFLLCRLVGAMLRCAGTGSTGPVGRLWRRTSGAKSFCRCAGRDRPRRDCLRGGRRDIAGRQPRAPRRRPRPRAGAPPSTSAAAGSFLERALAGEFKGKHVTATGPAVDADAVKMNAMFKDFTDQTGIVIDYAGTKQFEAVISAEVDGNNAPDIADFPQPGLLASFAKGGKVMDLSKYLDHGRPQGELHPVVARHGDDARCQRRRHGRRLGAGERQELRLVPQEGLRRGGLQGPDDVG